MEEGEKIVPPLTAAAVQWADERVTTLIRLYEEGYSASMIGGEMGITRNAVIGKIHRLKLPKRASVKRITYRRNGVMVTERVPRNAPTHRKKPVRTKQQRRAGIWNRIDSLLRDAGNAYKDLPIDASPYACTLLDLANDRSQCRYPVTTPEGESQLFCAAPAVEGCSYCARHAAICMTSKAKEYTESNVAHFVSIGHVASALVQNLEQRRRIDDAEAA
jgi:GcrA cell cycle regulator